MAKKVESIECSVYVDVSANARRGLGKENQRAGMVTASQMERHLAGLVKDELSRLEGLVEEPAVEPEDDKPEPD